MCPQIPSNVFHCVHGSFRFFIQSHQHFGQGIQHAGFFQITTEFFLFVIRIAAVVISVVVSVAVGMQKIGNGGGRCCGGRGRRVIVGVLSE